MPAELTHLPAGSKYKLEPHELVTYITAADQPNALRFHVAWEIGVTNAPIKMVYVDAVTGRGRRHSITPAPSFQACLSLCLTN